MNKTALLLGATIDPENGPECPYCNKPSKLRDSSLIYNGTSYGNVWMCANFPGCDAFVGTHKNGEYKNYPLGTLANKELRDLRKKVHNIFDVLWQKNVMSREGAYQWLRSSLHLTEPEGHMAEMDEIQCKQAYKLVFEKLTSINSVGYRKKP